VACCVSLRFVPECSVDSEKYLRGITLFNQAEFFDAHEALEDIWRAAPPENKKFLQGLIQVAVAFHHYSTGNRVGMRSVLERAIKNLSAPAGSFGKIQLTPLLQSLGQWREALDNKTALPALPRIGLLKADS
jgi:predicted metal-dependent hydrolase